MIKKDSDSLQLEPNMTERTIYIIFSFANIIVNFDHGILPAATKEIKQDLRLDDVQLGFLGSIVYGGLLIGSLAGAWAFQKITTKFLIFSTIILYIFSLFLFLSTDKLLILSLSRTLVGFFQVFLVIYFPVWVDLHGGVSKTIWLTFLQLGAPLGVFLGYVVTAIYVRYDGMWQYSFITQIILLIPCSLSILCFPRINLDAKGTLQQYKSLDSIVKTNEEAQKIAQNSPKPTEKEKTYIEKVKDLYQNKIFLSTMLTLASLYFVVTGIQFWISDYMQIVLGKDQKTVFTTFSLISITAPTLGVVIGGMVLHRCGGYTGKNVLKICITNGILASISAVPIPFINSFYIVVILLWLLLFFGGGLMPAVMGLMISCVPQNMRAFANSTAQLFHNLLGYLPAPFIYGFANQLEGKKDSRLGMIVLMFWSLWGVVGLYFAIRQKKFELGEQCQGIDQIECQQKEIQENQPDSPLPISNIKI